MSRSARKSAATAALLRHVDSRATGCLTSGAGASQIRVYLINGAVVGAETGDDQRQLAHLAHLRGALDLETYGRIDDKLQSGESIFGDLLDAVAAPLMEPLLLNRFHHNLASFLGGISKPEFEARRGVFVDNLQMGHNTITLIQQCCELWDAASNLDIDALIVRGPQTAREPEHKRILPFLSETPRTISTVLLDLPLEPLLARRLLLDMLQAGTAAVPSDEEVDDAPTVWVDADDIALDDPVVAGLMSEDEPTVHDGADEPEQAEEPTESVEAVAPSEDDAAAPRAGDGEGDEGMDEPVGDDDEEDEEADEDVGDDPTPAPAPRTGMNGISSLDAWLTTATMVDEDELDFFTDHDYERGAAEEGNFSTDAHNLDKVVVGGMGNAPQEPIPVDEAPTARFSAPVLSEDDALGKIEVANEVLGLVVKAFDEAEGTGRGRAVVQLLVDGSPSRFATLLHDVQVTEEGALPDEEILSNLYVRPPTEHRQLINQTLVDIIERALSSAADELPDDAFDTVLERVAGYRQRLGL